jgi:transcriptional regulator with XRE-family HTH domain
MPQNRWATQSERRFVDRMTEIRRERGISQERLAADVSAYGLDFPQSAVSKLERPDVDSRRGLRLSEALLIASILGEDFDDMLAGPLGDDAASIEELRQAVEDAASTLTQAKKTYERHIRRVTSRRRRQSA